MLVSMRRWFLRACACVLFAFVGILPSVSCVGDDPDSGTSTPDGTAPDTSTSTTDGASDASPDTGGSDSPAEASVDAGSLYANAVLSDQPIAYLRLGESAGPTAADEKKLYHGTYSGAVTFGQPGALLGDGNTGVQLGTSGFVELNDVLDLAGSVFSIEAWVKPNKLGVERGIVTKLGTTGYALILTANDKVQLHVNNTGAEAIASNATVPLGSFTHVVGVWDAQNAYIYFNGQQVGTVPVSLKPPDTNAHLGIGCLFSGSNQPFGFLDGTIDEVAIYDKALTQARVQAHYAASGR
jgi:hypothetical protein